MKTLLLISVGIALIGSCLMLKCIRCDPEKCTDPVDCKFGKTLDVCFCCQVCRKGPGEKCGGPWNIRGICAEHLICAREPEDKEHENYEGGHTTTWKPIREFEDGICRERS